MDYRIIKENLENELRNKSILVQSIRFSGVQENSVGTIIVSFNDNDLTLGDIKSSIEDFLVHRGISYNRIVVEL